MNFINFMINKIKSQITFIKNIKKELKIVV